MPAALWAVQDFFHDPMARPMRVIHGYLEPFARKALDRKRQRQEKGQMFDEDEVETYAEHLAASTDGACVSIGSVACSDGYDH